MPVYPEIASHLGVKGHGMFKAGGAGWVYQFLSLESYLRPCFKFYDTGPRDHMLKANGVMDAVQKPGLDVKSLERTV
jgi:hypothetical protein